MNFRCMLMYDDEDVNKDVNNVAPCYKMKNLDLIYCTNFNYFDSLGCKSSLQKFP